MKIKIMFWNTESGYEAGCISMINSGYEMIGGVSVVYNTVLFQVRYYQTFRKQE